MGFSENKRQENPPLTIHRVGDAWVIRISNAMALDNEANLKMEKVFRDLAERYGDSNFVLSFAESAMVGSIFIGLLFQFSGQVASRGGSVRLIVRRKNVQAAFDATKISLAMPIYSGLQAALVGN